MIPVKDDNPQLRFPMATYALIAANILSWFLFTCRTHRYNKHSKLRLPSRREHYLY